MKVGRPPNINVEPRIKEILEKHPYITRENLRKRYQEFTGKGIGFGTIDKYLKNLIKKDIVAEIINSKEIRKVAVYYLADGKRRRK